MTNSIPPRRRTPPPETGTITPEGRRSNRSSPPPLYYDADREPLPNRVDETDLNATHVTPAALVAFAYRKSH